MRVTAEIEIPDDEYSTLAECHPARLGVAMADLLWRMNDTFHDGNKDWEAVGLRLAGAAVYVATVESGERFEVIGVFRTEAGGRAAVDRWRQVNLGHDTTALDPGRTTFVTPHQIGE